MNKIFSSLRNIGGTLLALVIGFCAVFLFVMILPDSVVYITDNGDKVLRGIFGWALLLVPICSAIFRKRIADFIKRKKRIVPEESIEAPSVQTNNVMQVSSLETTEPEAVLTSDDAPPETIMPESISHYDSNQSETAEPETVLHYEKAIANTESCDYDELLLEAVDVIFDIRIASVSMLQRRLKLSYARAARIIDQMEELGVVGSFEDSKPRALLITYDQWLVLYNNHIKDNVHKKEHIENTDHPAATIDDGWDMRTIEKMEQSFEAAYNFAFNKMLNEHDCHLMFNAACKKWGRDDLPLPMQIRFEQLKEEYSEKFAHPNPLLYADNMNGHDFEHWCANLLKRNGFINVEVTQASNDQGVDVLAEKDGVRYAVQCKCYSSDLGNTPVQEVNTGKAIYHCHVGAVMTNRYFTSGAKEAAEATGVLLWDRDKLGEMLKNCENENILG